MAHSGGASHGALDHHRVRRRTYARRDIAQAQEELERGRPRTVLITGAGFSAPFGYPLTSQLLPRLAHKLKFIPPNQKEFTTLRPLEALLAHLDLNSDYEDLLSLIKDHADRGDKSWVKAKGLRSDQLFGSGDATFYYEMLVSGIDLVLAGARSWSAGEKSEQQFFQEIELRYRAWKSFRRLHGKVGPFCGVITTNYDMLPEQILISSSDLPDYGFDQGSLLDVRTVELRNEGSHNQHLRVTASAWPKVTFSAHPIYKIHGNQNSAICRGCGKVLVYRDSRDPLADHTVHSFQAWAQTTGFHFSFHCGEPMSDQPSGEHPHSMKPLILPPLRNKNRLTEWTILRQVRDTAMGLARDAERAFVVGSAVRQSDDELRQILLELKGKSVYFIGGYDG